MPPTEPGRTEIETEVGPVRGGTSLASPDLVAERLVARSALASDGSGCIRWQGAHTPKGYGLISVEGRGRRVHILAHLLWIGDIPEGCEIDHVAKRGCRWRDCLNPQHLEAVTHVENIARARRP